MKRNKIISIVITLAITICSLAGTFSFEAKEAKATSITQAQAVAWAQSKVGQSIDYDGVYGAQCVDFIKAYYNYLGVSPVTGNGADYASNSLPSSWSRVQGGTPQAGDILVYGASSSNQYGHVAIYESDYCTYHQNFNNVQSVQKVTSVRYNGLTNPYWGYIRPNFLPNDKVVFEVNDITNITERNAKISSWVSNSGTVTELGFYIGSSSDTNHQNRITTYTGNTQWTRFLMEYDISQYYGELNCGQEYNIVFYVISDGIEYKSNVKRFTTSGTNYISFDNYQYSNVAPDDFSFECWFSNPKEYLISSLGFLVGESINDMATYETEKNVSWTRALLKYNVADYKMNIKEDTNYYLRFYTVTNGVISYSDYIYIKTKKAYVQFDEVEIKDITNNNAMFSTWVSNEGQIDELGFYIGTSDDYQNRVVVNTNISWTRFLIEWNIESLYSGLNSGQTYTYVLFAKKGDKEYRSDMGHFTTKGTNDISFDNYSIENVSGNTATASVWMSNNNGQMIDSIGFLIGNDYKVFEKKEINTSISWTRALLKYDLEKYYKLNYNQKYYVKFYVYTNNSYYYSDYIIFDTLNSYAPTPTPTSTPFPTSTVVLPTPTPTPTVVPATPTTAPSTEPTVEPSSKPIAEPTTAPSAEPISEPITKPTNKPADASTVTEPGKTNSYINNPSNTVNGNSGTQTVMPSTSAPLLKNISIIGIKCKKHKLISGKISEKGVKVKIKVGKKGYKKAVVKGKKFTLKLPKKLTKRTKIKIVAIKSNIKIVKETFIK